MRFPLDSPAKVFFLHNDWGQTKCTSLKWLPFMSSWVNDYISSTQWWWLWFHSSLGYQFHVRVCKRVCYFTPPSLSLLSGGAWWSPSASMLGRTLKWHGWCFCSLSPAGSGQARYCLPPGFDMHLFESLGPLGSDAQQIIPTSQFIHC